MSNKLVGETDAVIWAEEFVKTVEENPTIPTDQGTMISWFANAIVAGRDAGWSSHLTASEALFGFAGWLTTRDEAVTASSKHDAGIWASLVSQFCEVNNLDTPRDGWDENLTHPKS